LLSLMPCVAVLVDDGQTKPEMFGVPLVTPGSYCVVFDTFVEDMLPNFFLNRPWDVGNNPKTASRQWLKSHPEFTVDSAAESRLMVTVAPEGFLKRIA
jgi:cephalosporin hydroxylase